MNCPKCGSALTPGALFCPVCNEPLSAGYSAPQGYQQPYAYPQQGYQDPYQGQSFQPTAPAQQPMGQAVPGQMPQPTQQPAAGYNTGGFAAYPQQGYQDPYQGQSFQNFPTGYQPPYAYGEQRPNANPVLSAISYLPHGFLYSFRNPSEVYREMLERNDKLTCPLVTAVMLLLSFLCGMTIMRSFVGIAFSLISTLTGVALASSSASMNQGISYVAGRIAPSVGGIAALCQLISILVPAIVITVYLTAVCKLRFSWPMALGLMTISTYPTVVIALVSMLASLLAPWLSIICILCGIVVSYVQLGALISFATGRTEQQLFVPKAVCLGVSLAVTLGIIALVGGVLMSGVLNRMLQLLTNVGSLI